MSAVRAPCSSAPRFGCIGHQARSSIVRMTAIPAAQLTGLPPKGGSMCPNAPSLLELAAGYDRADRHAVGEGLGHADNVGHDVGVLEGPHATGPSNARLDLVADEQNAVLVAEGAQLAQERGGSGVEASFALNRLDGDRGH